MTRSSNDKEVSERAKYLIDARLGERGKFGMLEEMSNISVGQWKNFYYGRQLVNEKMLAFLSKKYPHDAIWLLTGKKAPEQSEFPFLAPVPTEQHCQTIGERVNWVIREWASPSGKDLFRYLWERSGETISADEWSKVVLGLTEPTLEMIVVVCRQRPHFIQWVLLGYAGVDPQVDPTNQASITAWNEYQAEEWKSLENSVLPQTKGFTATESTKSARPSKTTRVSKKNVNKKG